MRSRRQRILMVAARYHPHLGGVENHLLAVNRELTRRGRKIKVLCEKRDPDIPDKEIFENVEIIRHRPLSFRGGLARGLLMLPLHYVLLLWKRLGLFYRSDLIHCHDWLPFIKLVLPFRLLFFWKPFAITFHGWEGRFPPSRSAIFARRFCEILTSGNICVGAYLTKWYGTKPTRITYGAADWSKNLSNEIRFDFCYAGRLEPDTGVDLVIEAWTKLAESMTEPPRCLICGDGSMKDEIRGRLDAAGLDCEIPGMVADLRTYVSASRILFLNSYLGIIEALQLKKPVFSVYQNELKKDYLTLAPGEGRYFAVAGSSGELAERVERFLQNDAELDIEAAHAWAAKQTWEKLADIYEELWGEPNPLEIRKGGVKDSEPKVSFITTVLNEEDSIGAFLESLLSQSRRPDEIIVVDGGSSDGTIAAIEKVLERESGARLIRESCSVARGRNIAIEAARHDLIAVSDAGCKLQPDWLEQILRPFQEPDMDVASGYYLPKTTNYFTDVSSRLLLTRADCLDSRNFSPSSRSIAFRKKAWRDVGGYPDTPYYGEDSRFNALLRKQGCRFRFVPKALVKWEPRKNFRAFIKQQYFYGFGDGFLRVKGCEYAVRLGVHGLVFASLALGFWRWEAFLFGGTLFVVYYLSLLAIRLRKSGALRVYEGPMALGLLLAREHALGCGYLAGALKSLGRKKPN